MNKHVIDNYLNIHGTACYVCEKDKSIHDNNIVMFYNSAYHCN